MQGDRHTYTLTHTYLVDIGGCAGSTPVAASLAAAAEVWRHRSISGGSSAGSTPAAAGLAAAAKVWRHRSISGGSRAAGAALPPCSATVATKIPAATAMVGALPSINNQLNAAAAMAMETTTTTTNKRKRRRQRWQLGGSTALASAAVRRQQCVISAAAVGSSAAAMFPLFITHDEYFLRWGGSGGG